MITNRLIGNPNAWGFDCNSSWLAGNLPLIRHRGLAGLGNTLRRLGSCVMLAVLALLLTTQAQENLTTGLVGYWSFDEGAGSLIADQSGKGNNGTLLRADPTAVWTQGHIGTALYFDGQSGAYVKVPSSQSLQDFTSMTFAAWVRCDDTERDAPVIAKETWDERSYWFGCFPSGAFGVLLGWNGWWVLEDRDNKLVIGGVWTHLVSVWDGMTLRHYQDGNYVAGGESFSGPLLIDDTFLAIGVNSELDDTRFKGVIDEVRIYNRALSETEVKALYAYDGNQTNQPLRVITELVPKGAWCPSTNAVFHKVVSSGTRAIVTCGDSEVHIIDLSNPAKPVLLGTWQPLFPPYEVELVGNLAYIASWEPDLFCTIEIVDFTDPAKPVLQGYYDTVEYAQDVEVVGSIAYVANSEAGLLILDASDPASPRRIGGYDTRGSVQSVQVAGRYAYIADGNWLVILDISNPWSPMRVGMYEAAGGIQGINARGSKVYLCEGTGELRILDVSDPKNVGLVGTYRGWGGMGQGMAVSWKKYAYLASGDRGLHIMDLGDPTNPVYLTGAWATPAEDVALMGNYALAAGGDKGLVVYEVQQHLYPPLKPPVIAGGMMSMTWATTNDIRLQKATNLVNAVWLDVPESEGTNTVTLPMTEGKAFYRLVKGTKPIQPPSGMVAWWPGDGNALDLVGTNHGTLHGEVTFAAGMVGQAFEVNGVDAYVSIRGSALDIRENLTMAGWVYFKGEGIGNSFVLFKKYENQGQYGFARYTVTGDSAKPLHGFFASLFTGVWTDYPAEAVLDDCQWYFLAVAYDKQNVKLYVDGVLNTSIPETRTLSGDGSRLMIGGDDWMSSDPSELTYGLIDEVMLFNRALTDAEIKAIYDAGSAGLVKPSR